jgi:hypothetical protein
MRIHVIRKMPLSIDEAETRCTLTAQDCAKRETATKQREKGFVKIPYIYGTFTKNGDDTQSFRPLVQEERGVLRVRLLALSTRVNTLFGLRQQRCG